MSTRKTQQVRGKQRKPKSQPRKKPKMTNTRRKPRDSDGTTMSNAVIPISQTSTLAYHTEGILNSVGLSQIARRWTPNCPYDMDPVLGSTATQGLSEMAAKFGYMRCLRTKYDFTIANLEVFPITLRIVQANFDPGTTGTGYSNLSTQDGGRIMELGAVGSGKDTLKLTGWCSVPRVVGDRSVKTDSRFSSTTAAIPSDQIWLGLGIETDGGNAFLHGIDFNIDLYPIVHFWEHNVLSTFDTDSVKVLNMALFNKKWESDKISRAQRLEANLNQRERERLFKSEQAEQIRKFVSTLADLNTQAHPDTRGIQKS